MPARTGREHEVVVPVGGDQDRGDEPLDLPDDGHGLQARQAGHVHVHQREMHFVLSDQLDGLFTALSHQCAKALRATISRSVSRGRPIIIGDENRIRLT